MNYCSKCGTEYVVKEWPRHCHSCNLQIWKRLDPVAICVLPVWSDDQLGYFIGERNGGYAFVGGFIENDEVAQDAAIREFQEETNIPVTSPEFICQRNTTRGQLLNFMICDPVDISVVEKYFRPTDECPSYKIAWKPERLIFPLHEEILKFVFSENNV